MLTYIRKILILVLLSQGGLLYAQYRAADYLWSISDEILLVKVTKDEMTLFGSLTTSTSAVTAQILKTYRSKRFTSEMKEITFFRLRDRSPDSTAIIPNLITPGKQYVIFLSSEKPGSYQTNGNRKTKAYGLADIYLGMQEPSRELEGFLTSKQGAKN